MNFKKLFKVPKPIIGMVHVDALPGTPKYNGDKNKIIDKSINEAKIQFPEALLPSNLSRTYRVSVVAKDPETVPTTVFPVPFYKVE